MYFQYFFPNRTKITLDELVAAGLGYVFEPETAARPIGALGKRQVTNGPGGQHGLIVSLSSDFCGFDRDGQVWKQEIDADYWVGMWSEKAKRPTPESLARENQILGEPLLLDDGNVWTLPKARHFGEKDGTIIPYRTLPTRRTRDESGNWFSGEVKDRYRELWRMAVAIWSPEGSSLPDSEYDNVVIECFKTNYRVSAIEIDLLGIHDDDLLERVRRILLDWDNYEILVKKKLTTLVTGSSSYGHTESQPDVDTAATTQQ